MAQFPEARSEFSGHFQAEKNFAGNKFDSGGGDYSFTTNKSANKKIINSPHFDNRKYYIQLRRRFTDRDISQTNRPFPGISELDEYNNGQDLFPTEVDADTSSSQGQSLTNDVDEGALPTGLQKMLQGLGGRLDGGVKTAEKRAQILRQLEFIGMQKLSRVPESTECEGTCAWLVDRPEYLTWRDAQRSCALWLEGIVGCGKTTIMQYTYHQLTRNIKDIKSAIITPFFCSEVGAANVNSQAPQTLLRLLLHDMYMKELVSPSMWLADDLEFDTLLAHLTSLLRSPKKACVYLLLDALDECPSDSQQRIQKLISVVTADQQHQDGLVFKILVSIRQGALVRKSAGATITITPEISTPEIDSYVEHELQTICPDGIADVRRASIKRQLSLKSAGMFRWTQITLDDLRAGLWSGKYTSDQIETIIEKYPIGLDEIYRAMLRKLSPLHHTRSASILRWVIHAIRPLTLKELNTMLKFTNGHPIDSTTNENNLLAHDINALLRSFVFVVNETITFCHQSALEFFIKDDLGRAFLLGECELSKMIVDDDSQGFQSVHEQLAVTCFDYVASLQLQQVISQSEYEFHRFRESTFATPDFLLYAIDFGLDHLRRSGEADAARSAFKRLFQQPQIRKFWLNVYWDLRSEKQPRHATWTCLQMTCYFNLPVLFREEMAAITQPSPWYMSISLSKKKKSSDTTEVEGIETPDWEGRTCLHLAAMGGSPWIVTELLTNGAEVNALTRQEETPLLLAIAAGNLEAFLTLLRRGADSNRPCLTGHTPLHVAAETNQLIVMELLMENSDTIDCLTERALTPLHIAALHGNEDACSLLLKRKADFNLCSNSKSSTLYCAAFSGTSSVVKLLLQYGVSVHCADVHGSTPLHVAAFLGSAVVARQLIDAGAVVECKNNHGQTPLIFAVASGHLETLKLLLDSGAHIDSRDDEGFTPLQAAVEGGHTEAVAFLIDKGANVSQPHQQKRPILHIAAIRGHADIAKLLIDNGADVNELDEDQQTALHTACQEEHESIVQILLECGRADVDRGDGRQWTALHIACDLGYVSIVRLLLNSGADVNKCGENWYTALHYACLQRHEATVLQLILAQLLIQSGAATNVLDVFNVSPLQLACMQRVEQKDLVQCLLSHGAKVNEVDVWGKSAMFKAAQRGYFDTVRLLLTAGADPSKTTPSGSSCLHFASVNGKEAVVEVLLEAGAESGLQDHLGETALHLAARKGHSGVVKALLSQPQSPTIVDCQSDGGYTALFDACATGHREIVTELINHNAQVNLADNMGHTPFNETIHFGHVEISFDLLRAGAVVDSRSVTGLTPFLNACFKNRSFIIKHLIDTVDVNQTDHQGMSALCYAVETGNIDLMRMLVRRGASPQLVDDIGQTLCHLAAISGNVPCIEYAFTLGVSVQNLSNAGRTPLHIACRAGNIDMVQWLLDHESDVNTADHQGFRPIHSAAQEGHLEIVQMLLSRGADAVSGENHGWTPLHSAAASADLDVVQALISAGAQTEAQTEDGWSVLHTAAGAASPHVAELLLDHGVSLEVNTRSCWTPLHCAAGMGHLDLIKRLKSLGLSVTDCTKGNDTALHFAADKMHQDVVAWLLESGADVDAGNEDGFTPLIVAALSGSIEVVKILLKSGANINHQNKTGVSALLGAVNRGHLEVVRFLAEATAELNVRLCSGATLLHISATRHHTKILKFLLDNGTLEIDAKTEDGRTALHLAMYQFRIPTMDLLLKHGADPNILDCFGRSCFDWALGYEPIMECLLSAPVPRKTTDPSTSKRIVIETVLKITARSQPAEHEWHLLGQCLSLLQDQAAACTSFEQTIEPETEGGKLIQGATCSICDIDETIVGLRFVCIQCPDTDLCEECMSCYRRRPSFYACRNHTFLQVPGPGWADRPKGIVNNEGQTLSDWLDSVRQKYSKPEESSLECTEETPD